MDMTRRSLLTALGVSAGAAAVAAPGFAAGSDMPGWQVGYANAPAAGFGPAEMDLISGRFPSGFAGSFYRNGPGWFQYGDDVLGHWFDGDGMVQRIAFDGGKAIHAGAFVQTNKHRSEQAAGRFRAAGFGSAGDPTFPIMSSDDVNAANTSVIMVNGELLALWEGGSPFALDAATLETKGPKVLRDDLKGMPFLAHPKIEPNGTIWNLGVAGSRVGVYKMAASGSVTDFQMIDIGKASYIHDWAMTERHLIIIAQPWIMTRNIPPFVNTLEWHPDEGLDLIIIEKDDFSNRRTVTVDAHAFYHTGAAWEDASGAIHVDLALYDQPFLGEGGATNLMKGEFDALEDQGLSRLSRVIIPARGPARIEKTHVDGEFPVVHPGFHGLERRLTALVGGSAPGRPGARRVSTMDWKTGVSRHFDYGLDRIPEEHLFVAKPGGRVEADAWLVGTVLNTRTQRSEVHIFDVADVSAGPVASFAARYAWPLGFHGTFAPA
ncbi:MAG: carotenoid oxygenase family protein [Pseudomonadota bacterium]